MHCPWRWCNCHQCKFVIITDLVSYQYSLKLSLCLWEWSYDRIRLNILSHQILHCISAISANQPHYHPASCPHSEEWQIVESWLFGAACPLAALNLGHKSGSYGSHLNFANFHAWVSLQLELVDDLALKLAHLCACGPLSLRAHSMWVRGTLSAKKWNRQMKRKEKHPVLLRTDEVHLITCKSKSSCWLQK